MNPLFELYVFNVGLGQSIFFRPVGSEINNLMIDIGHVDNKHPIDFIINQGVLPVDQNGDYYIGNLVFTNYDHDHYSGLPYLINKVKINRVNLIKSINPALLDYYKQEKTEALNCLADIKNTYIYDSVDWTPPYQTYTKYLYPLETWNGDFNNLSQIIFIEYMGFVICIPGDLEKEGWEYMLSDIEVTSRLQKTQIFFASHHGRENGYVEEIFAYCKPSIVIVSDKEIIHSTQEKTADRYRKHVVGDGLNFNGEQRKVLSTRCDGSFCFKGYHELKYSVDKVIF